jgi:hypothetical protein
LTFLVPATGKPKGCRDETGEDLSILRTCGYS